MEHSKPLEILTPQEASLESSEYLEKEILKSISLLPREIQEGWIEKFEEAEDLKQFKEELAVFTHKRENALASSVEIFPVKSEEIREEIRKVVSIISSTFGNMNYFLGNGYTAEVYELPVAPHLCVKYIHDQEAYNENNHLRVEYDFLCRLNEVSERNIRTPSPAFLRIHPSEGHVYGMEKVNGKSLSQILEKPGENENLIKVIQRMDKKEALASMKAYIEKMHELKITHNDLFMRNIMIDNEGNFFVIDFGKAKHEDLGEDRSEERRRDLFLANNELSLFFNKIDKLEIK